MVDFFLLSEEQVFGEQKLDIFNKYPVSSSPTDYAKIIGTYVTNDENSEELADWWLQKDPNKIFCTIVNSKEKQKVCVRRSMNGYGIRPAVKYSDIKPFTKEMIHIDDDNVFEVEFGEYPQRYVSSETQTMLDTLYMMGSLESAGDNKYKYNGSYVTKNTLNSRWIISKPITWIVDKNADIALSKYILDGGKKSYDQVISFLKNDFSKVTISQDHIIQFAKIKRYNELKRKKAEIEAELKELDKEIMTLRRKK